MSDPTPLVPPGRLPPFMVRLFIGLTFLPVLLGLLGLDFGAERAPQWAGVGSEAVLTSIPGTYAHLIFEWTAVCSAAFTLILAGLHYAIRREPWLLLLALALFLLGAVDAYHTLVTDRIVPTAAPIELAGPFSWTVARATSGLVVIGLLISLLPRSGGKAPLTLAVAWMLLLTGGAVIATMTVSELPQTLWSDGLVPRPYDVGILVIFAIAFGLSQRLVATRPSAFAHAFSLALIAHIVCQLHIGIGSLAPYDHHFNMAHWVKLLAYLLPLTGLMFDSTRAYRHEALSVQRLQEVRASLTQRQEELERLTTTLVEEVTRRQRAEFNHRVSGELYRTLAKNLPNIAVFMFSPDLRFMVAGGGGLTDQGFTQTHLQGKYVWEAFPPALSGVVLPYCGAAIEGESASFEHQSGGRFHRMRTVPIQADGGVVVAGLLVSEDTTELKHTETELRAFARQLELSNQELQSFASVAAHDLQEPLRKIETFGERLNERYASALEGSGQVYLERMRSAAHRMRTLINDLLTYSRVTTRAKPFGEVDMAEIATDVVSDMDLFIEQVGGRVEIGELPIVVADPTQMYQLLQNLIQNALKYHRDDLPPVVHIESESGSQSESSPRLRFVVRDNGIGFDEKYTERIFSVFQRLHDRSRYEGTGMGLAICRKIVERHGGTINATSTPGHGTEFVVTLPLRQPEGGSE